MKTKKEIEDLLKTISLHYLGMNKQSLEPLLKTIGLDYLGFHREDFSQLFEAFKNSKTPKENIAFYFGMCKALAVVLETIPT